MSARGRHIATVAGKRFLFGLWYARFGLASASARRAAFARQTRFACEELGPAFIKLGQLASVRPDIFSAEAVFELERLQDSVPPVPIERIRRAIHGEFGQDADALFDEFEDVPVASASIAQVHRARLKAAYRPVFGAPMAAGTAIAIKVVRPGATDDIRSDIELAHRWLRWIPRFGLLARIDLEAFLGEFEVTLRSETDLRNEGRVAERFAFDVRDDELVLVPRVVWTRTTRRVLTMEFVEGWRLTELTDAERDGVDARALAIHGADVFMRQVLVLGRYHADLHPANLFVTPDSRICYLDFGIVGITLPAQRIAIAQVLAATVYGDADRAVRYSRELGLEIPTSQEAAVRDRVAALMNRTLRRPGQRADVRGFAIGFLSMLADFKIAVPVGYGLLIKALVTVEGVAQAIYPDIDITQTARPFATRLIAQEMLRPGRINAKAPEMLRAAMRVLSE
ncbi:MAG: AarF/UbiB family protein [Coriobacteriia bacterium]|nr:AarF/UbiB family protein [Coriobacteriia bacterium]